MQRIPSCFAAVLVLVLACGKGSTPAPTTPSGAGTATVEVERVANCVSAYSTVGAVRSGVLTESIDSVVFTDALPFECTLTAMTQQVVFSFNETTTDPSSDCKYELSYTVSGNPMSSPQTLNCSNHELTFTTTATPDAGEPACSGKQPIVLDPKIKLKTNNCGGDEDDA